MRTIASIAFILTTFIFNADYVYAGLPQEKVKLSKEERKKIKEAEENEKFIKTAALINQKNFVLKAEYLIFKDGKMVSVDSKINFILVDTAKTTIQTGEGIGVGENGVGGITADGKITNWQLKENQKRKNFSLSFNLSTLTGRFIIVMDIEADGKTRASVTAMSKGLLLNLNGNIVKLKGSGIFKGSAYY